MYESRRNFKGCTLLTENKKYKNPETCSYQWGVSNKLPAGKAVQCGDDECF